MITAANKRSLVVDYNTLANEQQVIAFFLPEAPTEMLKIFDEVCVYVCTYMYVYCMYAQYVCLRERVCVCVCVCVFEYIML